MFTPWTDQNNISMDSSFRLFELVLKTVKM